METHSERREESSPTIIASKKSLRFVNEFHRTHYFYSLKFKIYNRIHIRAFCSSWHTFWSQTRLFQLLISIINPFIIFTSG